jgi:hypothetical protein
MAALRNFNNPDNQDKIALFMVAGRLMSLPTRTRTRARQRTDLMTC